MTTDTLPQELRAIVDAVETPSFADIRTHTSSPKRTRSPRSRVAIALAAVLLVVALGAGVVALLRDDSSSPASHPDVLNPRPDVVDTVPKACIITLSNYPGCAMTAKRAQQYLGFRPSVPTGIPEGWVRQPSRLKIYRSQFDASSLPPGTTETTEFFQIWAPPGSPPVATRPTALTCAPFLMVREQLALVGDEAVRTDIGTVELGNGRVVNGTIGPESCGVMGGTVDPYGSVFWADRGRSFSVTANGIPNDEFLAIARSLDR